MNEFVDRYRRDGFVSGVPILSTGEATAHRRRLEEAEAQLGPLHYRDKISTLLPSAHELATHPAVLDVVEACIGPDILVYNATYIIKEPATEAHVEWHQDLTYWGLADDDAQVSMWLALAPATEESGCMTFLPGTHLRGKVAHKSGGREGTTKTNVLLLDQRIEHPESEHGLDLGRATVAALAPGEASFHHGWTVHASAPNRSTDRRIGLNVQYVAPHNRVDDDEGLTALLARGSDPYEYFGTDPVPSDLNDAAVMRWEKVAEAMKAGFTLGTDD